MNYYLKCEFEDLTMYLLTFKSEHIWTCVLPMFDRPMRLKSIQVLKGLGNNLEIVSDRKEQNKNIDPYTLTTLNVSYDLFVDGECCN